MTSQRRLVSLISAGAVALASASVIASSSQAALGDVEYLLVDTSAAPVASLGATVQPITVANNCLVTDADGPPALIDISVTGGDLGFTDNGFGVKAKGPGRNCGQITGDQSLALALGTDVDAKIITDAEVDIESKFACEAIVEYWRDGSLESTETIPLSDQSDCGPDSGNNDNKRVQLTLPTGGADSIVFKAGSEGAISIEGGAQSSALPGGLAASAGTDASVFQLEDRGIDCLGTGFNTDAVEGVALVRTDPDSEQCAPIPYELTRAGNTVTLEKEIGDQTFATFTLDVEWNAEAATYPLTATQIDYTPSTTAAEGGTDPVDMQWCASDDLGNPMLPGDLNPVTLDVVDGWCVTAQSASLVANNKVEVSESYYGKGDPRFLRP